jgi:hypothetical protein
MAPGIRARLTMIREELRQLDQSPRALRSFGRLVGGVLLVFAALGGWRAQSWWPWVAGPGLTLFLLGVLAPRSLRWPHRAWMTLALIMGTVMGTVLLTLVFFLGVTPLGWLARVSGRDFLRRQRTEREPTYWLARDRSAKPGRADYERQF